MEITVYSTPLCVPSGQLKTYLRAHDVEFIAKDLMMDEAAAEFIDGHNIRTSPVLQIGDQLLHGAELHPEKIDAVLGLE